MPVETKKAVQGVVERPLHTIQVVAQLRTHSLTKTTMFSLASNKNVFAV